MSVLPALFLAMLLAFSIGRLLWPRWRLRRLRRELAVAIAIEEAAVASYDYSVADMDDIKRDMVPVHLRRVELQSRIWRLAPLREIDAECRQLEARLADPAAPAHERTRIRSDLESIRTYRELRPLELPDWASVVAIVLFVGLLVRAAWRMGLPG